MGKLICMVIILMLIPSFAYSLSDTKYNQYMKRSDFKGADDEMNKSWKHLKALLSEQDFKFILNNQRKWVKNGREKEVKYIEETQPFYDKCRMYAISSYARAIYLGEIANFLQNNKKYTQKDLNNFVSSLDYIKLLNSVAHKFEPNLDLSSNDHSDVYVHCTYNYDTGIGDILGFASEVLGFFTGMKAEIAGLAAEAFSNTESHTFQCKFNNKVKKYSVAYFYSGNLLNEKFRKKETHALSKKDYINGVKFSSTTSKSNLDFITIRVDVEVDGEIIKTIYVYEIDQEHNKLNPIDEDTFFAEIVDNYEER